MGARGGERAPRRRQTLENVVNTGLLRVSTATVVAIVPPGPRTVVVETLSALSIAGVRPIIISLADDGGSERHVEDGTVVIEKLRPRFLDNAVACLRLSSLPTLVWWRAPGPAILQELAALVDRVVLDVDDPSGVWPLVPAIGPVAAISDMRWARLTRWRGLVAQFFDMPDVGAHAGSFERLGVAGSDPFEMRLLAGWLKARLPAGERLHVDLDTRRGAAIQSLRLAGPHGTLAVELLPGSPCVATSANMSSGRSSRRVVPAGDDRPLALLNEELRVRSRDFAFEDAVREAERL